MQKVEGSSPFIRFTEKARSPSYARIGGLGDVLRDDCYATRAVGPRQDPL